MSTQRPLTLVVVGISTRFVLPHLAAGLLRPCSPSTCSSFSPPIGQSGWRGIRFHPCLEGMDSDINFISLYHIPLAPCLSIDKDAACPHGSCWCGAAG